MTKTLQTIPKHMSCCANCKHWHSRSYIHCQHSGPFGGNIPHDPGCTFTPRNKDIEAAINLEKVKAEKHLVAKLSNKENPRTLVREEYDTSPMRLVVSQVDRHEIEAKTPKSTWEFYKSEFSDEDVERIKVGVTIVYASGVRFFSDGMKEHFRQFSVEAP